MVDHQFDRALLGRQMKMAYEEGPLLDRMSVQSVVRKDGDTDLKPMAAKWSSDISDDFDDLRATLVRKMHDAQERYLLSYFGSYEVAKQLAHLYVFEPTDMVIHDSPDAQGMYSIEYSYRVRPKTKDEIMADQAVAENKPDGTRPLPENDIHEWQWVSFSFAGWIECICGYRPQNQEEMDAHIPPV